MTASVAYPGRDGAHSAAACDRLFPSGADLVSLPSFTAVVEATVGGRGRLRRAAHRELALGAGQRDARSPLRLAALDHRRDDPADPPLPGRPRGRRRSRRSGSSARTRPRSTSAGVCSPRCRGRLRSPPRRRPTRRTRWPRTTTLPKPRSPASAPPPCTASRVIAGDVGDHPEAYTRFVSVAPYTRLDRESEGWRTAFSFVTDHQPGALHRAIEPFGRHRLDMVQLVSRPIPRTPWRYRFDAVLAGHPLDAGRERDARGGAGPDAGAPRLRLLPGARVGGGRPGSLRDGLVALGRGSGARPARRPARCRA